MNFEAIPNEVEGEPPELKQIEKIKGYIEKYAIPLFEEGRTEKELKKFIAKNKLLMT